MDTQSKLVNKKVSREKVSDWKEDESIVVWMTVCIYSVYSYTSNIVTA